MKLKSLAILSSGYIGIYLLVSLLMPEIYRVSPASLLMLIAVIILLMYGLGKIDG